MLNVDIGWFCTNFIAFEVGVILSTKVGEFMPNPCMAFYVTSASAYQIEDLISPVIALILSILFRRFTLNNKIPFLYFLDEATLCFSRKQRSRLRRFTGNMTAAA